MEEKCPFCDLPKDRIWFESKCSVAILDAFPITNGHTLVIPKRHVESVFDLPQNELDDLSAVVAQTRSYLKKKFNTKSFNIGINEGAAAGQTISHAHVHVIPRRTGDVQDPRGGIRWIIPGKAKYW